MIRLLDACVGWFQSIPPRHRVRAAMALLLTSIVAWPVLALTLFRSEPQGILGLSFLAIITTMWDVVTTTDVRETEEGL